MAAKTHLHHGDHGNDERLRENARRTLLVLIFTVVVMAVEIVFGFASGSMALLADGWHMASHAVAFAIAWGAYRIACSPRMQAKYTFGGGKVLALGGYTSALLLGFVAVATAYESVTRFFAPVPIAYGEALIVTGVGLVANIVGAVLLGQGHHEIGHKHGHAGHHHEPGENAHTHEGQERPRAVDRNLRGAYLHVLADLFTSVLALVALGLGAFYGLSWLDPVAGIIGALMIARWSVGLVRDTTGELLDAHADHVPPEQLAAAVRALGAEVVDAHVWKIGPTATACELVVRVTTPRGGQYYRDRIAAQFALEHLVVEELYEGAPDQATAR